MKKLLFATVAICVPSLAHAFVPVRYVQISTNSLSMQSGGINIGSATIVADTVSTETIKSSATILGNMQVNGVFQATSTVTLGSAGNSVTVSSNAVLPGATFYQFGLAALSNGKKPVCTSVTTSSATTTTQFADTGLTVSITPIGTNVAVWAGGTVDNSASSYSDSSLARGASSFGFTNLGATDGICENGSSAATTRASCFMYFVDTSATAGSSNTYRVIIKSNTSGTTTWGADTTTNYICAMEVY